MAENTLNQANTLDEKTAQKSPKRLKKPTKKKKLIKRLIIIAIILAVIVAGVFFGIKLFSSNDDESMIQTDFVSYGSITSTVTGEGITKAQDSATMTLTIGGTVSDVYVSTGDFVTAGTELYKITSQAALDAVTEAQQNVDNCQKELDSYLDASSKLTVTADFSGKLIDVSDIDTHYTVSAGEVIAQLVDDSKMRLTQYYSYAYENDIKQGSSVTVSIPSTMSQLKGTVDAVYKVNRISPEGTKLFEASIVITNPGTLTSGVSASATMNTSSGETIYPYEAAELEYNKSSNVIAEVGGPVQKVNLRNYAMVKAGETLLVVSGEDNEHMRATAEKQLKTAQNALEEAEKNLELLNGVSPIDGTVLSIDLIPGEDVEAGTTVVSIADTSSIIVEAPVDERNIGYIEKGMYVDIDQWGTVCGGTVTSVSMESTVENGVARFPITISVDNTDGILMPGSYVTYSIIASQNDNCLVLPIQSVKYIETEYGNDTVVFVKSDSRPESAIDVDAMIEGLPDKGYWAVPVVIGISDTYNVEIISGVNEGDEVFTQIYKEEAWY